MDEEMLKAGGSAKREELVKAFGDLNFSSTQTRDLTEKEKQIAMQGDKGQGDRLTNAKK